MTIPENNVNSSSSATPAEMTDILSAFENLPPLKIILSYIKEDMSSYANGEGGSRNRCRRRYLIENEDEDDDDSSNSNADEKVIVSDELWNPENVDWTLHDNNDVAAGNTKHEPSSDLLLSPSQGNVYVPSLIDVSSEDDTISNVSDNDFAKDTSIAKSSGVAVAPDTVVNEEDVQERTNKAAFAQELFMSTLFRE